MPQSSSVLPSRSGAWHPSSLSRLLRLHQRRSRVLQPLMRLSNPRCLRLGRRSFAVGVPDGTRERTVFLRALKCASSQQRLPRRWAERPSHTTAVGRRRAALRFAGSDAERGPVVFVSAHRSRHCAASGTTDTRGNDDALCQPMAARPGRPSQESCDSVARRRARSSCSKPRSPCSSKRVSPPSVPKKWRSAPVSPRASHSSIATLCAPETSPWTPCWTRSPRRWGAFISFAIRDGRRCRQGSQRRPFPWPGIAGPDVRCGTATDGPA